MSTEPAQQSAFVTIVAWVFIVLSGFGTFIAVMQNITVHFLLPMDAMRDALQQSGDQAALLTRFASEHLQLYVSLLLLLTLLVLVAAIGLLRRKNWARISFMALMIVAIAWNLGSLALQQFMLRDAAVQGTADLTRQTQGMTDVFNVFSIILAVALSIAFGWIAWRLSRPAIRAEFERK